MSKEKLEKLLDYKGKYKTISSEKEGISEHEMKVAPSDVGAVTHSSEKLAEDRCPICRAKGWKLEDGNFLHKGN